MSSHFAYANLSCGEGESQVAFLAWHIRKSCCAFVFEGKKINPAIVLSNVINHMTEFIAAQSTCASNQSTVNFSSFQTLWSPPPQNWLKVNIDAAFYPPSKAVAAVVCRNSDGVLFNSFASCFSCGSAVEAEAMALKQAIKFASRLGLSYIIFESDALVVLNTINSSNYVSPWVIKSIVEDIKLVAAEVDNVRF